MSDSTASIRLKHFIEYLEMSNSQFADTCGIPRPTLSQLLTGRNKKLSDQVLRPIHEHFPELSLLWLMFGEGEMLDANVSTKVTSVSDGLGVVSNEMENGISNERTNLSKLFDSQQFIESSTESNDLKRRESKISNRTPSQYRDGNNDLIGNRGNDFKGLHDVNTSSDNGLRSVKSVVVYYDDNTYETFIPGQNGLLFL